MHTYIQTTRLELHKQFDVNSTRYFYENLYKKRKIPTGKFKNKMKSPSALFPNDLLIYTQRKDIVKL